MKAFVIAVVLLTCGATPWLATRAGAQRWHIDSTCLQLWFDFDHGWNDSVYHLDSLYNPDSVMRDTCMATLGFPDFGVWITTGIRMLLPIRLPWKPKGSIMEIPWTAIDTDTVYLGIKPVRNALKDIYDSIGPYLLRKINPEDTFPGGESYTFVFHFFSYTPADSIYPFLAAVPDSDLLWFYAQPQMPGNGGVVKEQRNKTSDNLRIFPQPAWEVVRIKMDQPSAYEEKPRIADALGRNITNFSTTVETSGTYLLNIVALLPGLYYVRLGSYAAPLLVEPGR